MQTSRRPDGLRDGTSVLVTSGAAGDSKLIDVVAFACAHRDVERAAVKSTLLPFQTSMARGPNRMDGRAPDKVATMEITIHGREQSTWID
jgi:hypothetical protein